ncbi:hypothetical protein FHX37_3815 [Haloactinospora alba]|uniref:AEC family transporter n=1 Tax=Haloactinospora alba TaxID=405555 RepID=A0A543N9I4_9ACTN|nr:AEC family transporter [Haloactinospora alba]TQN28470.1 hypothetical protein FHX37_3815 [Haloactinospora alba]
MGGVVTGFSVIATVIAIGYVLGWRGALGRGGREVLTRLAFYAATPALLFDIVSGADLSVFLSRSIVATAGSVAVVALLFAAAGAVFGWGAGATTLGVLCSCYVNAGNLGIPVAVYVLGDASVVAPVLLLQQLVITPVALTVLEVSNRPPGERSGIPRLVSAPVRTPIVLASTAGAVVAASGWVPPAVLMRPVELLGGMAVPAVLLAFGISLHGSALPARGPERGAVLFAVALKSLVHPLVAWVAGILLGLDGASLFAVVVVAALPTAQNIFTYASRYDVATRMVRESVLLSTFLTVPVLLLLAVLLG